MHKSNSDRLLYLYLSLSDTAIASTLVWEDAKQQHPVYFINKALQRPELRYQKLEEVAFALVVTAQHLCQYFQAHLLVVRIDQPIRQILPDLIGKMMAWSVELSKFDIRYKLRIAVKAQLLVDFLVEMVYDKKSQASRWTLFVDGASSAKGIRVK